MRGFKQAQVLTAIKGSAGIMSTIARRLDCDWTTAKKYVNKWDKTRQAFADEDEAIIDLAESILYKSIRAGDTRDAKWLLSKRRKAKYSERQEVTGADGDAMDINLTWGDPVDD